jgi:hypothetical protein
MAHNAVETQTKLSDNSTLHYYVGPAPYTKQGISLYNPITKLVVIRRSYQKLDLHDPALTIPPITVSTDDSSSSTQPPELTHDINIPTMLPSPPNANIQVHPNYPNMKFFAALPEHSTQTTKVVPTTMESHPLRDHLSSPRSLFQRC